jgi:hypothetical protein
VDKTTKVSLEALIHVLRLAIRLWVVCGTHAECDTSQCKQLPPEVASEHTVTVRDERYWHAVQLVNIVHISLSDRHSCVWMLQW